MGDINSSWGLEETSRGKVHFKKLDYFQFETRLGQNNICGVINIAWCYKIDVRGQTDSWGFINIGG